MTRKTSIALALAIALSPAAALAASKHQVHHQVGPSTEQTEAYAYENQNAPSVSEPSYMQYQDNYDRQ
jgi:hypothetical protein